MSTRCSTTDMVNAICTSAKRLPRQRVRAETERCPHAGCPPVLVPFGKVAVDVETLGIGIVLGTIMGNCEREHDLAADGHLVARELEGVDHLPQSGRSHRVQAQRLHRKPVRDVHHPELLGCRAFPGEQLVRLDSHGGLPLGILDQRMEHEGGDIRGRVEAREEGSEAGPAQIVLGQELGVGAMQPQEVVDQVRLHSGAKRRVVSVEDRRGQSIHPITRAPKTRCAQEGLGKCSSHSGQHSVEVVGEIVHPFRRAGTRAELRYLLGHHGLQLGEDRERLSLWPRRYRALGDARGVFKTGEDDVLRIPAAQGLADAKVFAAVHVDHEPVGAEPSSQGAERIEGAQIQPTFPLQEVVRFGPRQNREGVEWRADAEDGTELPVLSGEKVQIVGHKAQPVPQDRQATGHGDSGERLGARLAGGGGLGALGRRGRTPNARAANRVGDRTADQIEAPEEIDSIRHLGPLLAGKYAIEDAAGVDERDQHRVARLRNIFGEEDPHDALFDLPACRAAHPRISSGPCHPARQG